ncbi:MAG: hypothetical protein ACPGVD_12205, partial [Flavobacteriales bacterium]
TNSDGQLVEVLDETPRLVGWVAELGSIRSGTIEYVFYNNDWSEIGKLIKSDKVKEVGEINYNYCKQHHNLTEINKKRLELLLSVCK